MQQRQLQRVIGTTLTISLAVALGACGGSPGSSGADGSRGPTGPSGPQGGSGPAGASSLVKVTSELPGLNCPFGGARIETGLDANRNGQLDAGEVDAAATSFVCTFGPSGTISPSSGIHIAIKQGGVSTAAGAPITVRFTLKDDRGFPLDLAGAYSLNAPIQPRFAIGHFTTDPATGQVTPLTMYSRVTSAAAPAGEPTSYDPLGVSPGHGSVIENGLGAGDYTYTFPTSSTLDGPVAVAYDAARRDETHVVWIQATRQTDLTYPLDDATFTADAQPSYFVPSGVGVPLTRELVSQARCDACHARLKAATPGSALHGGGSMVAGMCNACHNPGHTSDPLEDSASFVHRIHAGASVATANLFHGIAPTYPQDLRRCEACHGGAAQGDQALTNPSRLACQGCHDYVSFTASAAAVCQIAGHLERGADGKPLPCNHVVGPSGDASCSLCHGPSGSFPTASAHQPVIPPDPANAWLVPLAGNPVTNASWVAAAGQVPPGASVITYDVKSVDAVVDTTVTPNVKRPQITFKLRRNGVDVTLQGYAPGASPPVTELMPDFVGSPSVYFAFAVPQDGNPTPADFNASASGYLRRIWDGSATGAGAGTLTGPDAGGYYTVRLTGVQIPATATLLTGGLGYTSSLASTPPLVQTNVPKYPWIPNVPADGKAQGGLSVPAPNVWRAATGYAGRRAIVDTARCNSCHGALGVAPTFHAGQANDGPTCSFCHTPNRAVAGWSTSSKYFIHAIHAGRSRTVPYTWHASEVGPGYDGVAFPGTQSGCTTCHLPDTYDFGSPASLATVPSLAVITAATGRYDPNPLTNSTFYTLSPWVVADGVTDYGAGFSYNAATGLTTQAAGATLVHSPITGVCVSCHDSTVAINHMTSTGGQFYASRSTVLALGASQEQCLLCHGPGRVAAIGVVHPR
jgi:OmcA/MtrC family decaheme c-type cytochrome